jgi:hypothetical protein
MKVDIDKSQETLQLHSGCGLRPIHHRFHLVRMHPNTPCSDDISKEGDGGAKELTLLRLHEQLVMQETLKDLLDMEDVLLSWNS